MGFALLLGGGSENAPETLAVIFVIFVFYPAWNGWSFSPEMGFSLFLSFYLLFLSFRLSFFLSISLFVFWFVIVVSYKMGKESWSHSGGKINWRRRKIGCQIVPYISYLKWPSSFKTIAFCKGSIVFLPSRTRQSIWKRQGSKDLFDTKIIRTVDLANQR